MAPLNGLGSEVEEKVGKGGRRNLSSGAHFSPSFQNSPKVGN